MMQGAGDKDANYSGKFGDDDIGGVDTAYRVIADHLRMVLAVASYCAQNGKRMTFFFVLVMKT